MTYPSIVILRGTDPYSALQPRAVHQASLIACTVPNRRGLFKVIKAQELPANMRLDRVLGNVTRKTLEKLISANLA